MVCGYKKMALSAIDLVKNGDIKFVPSNWEKTYFSMARKYPRLVHQSSVMVGS